MSGCNVALHHSVPIQVFQTPGEDEPLAAGTASRPEVLAETLLQRRRVLTRAALELAIMSSISHPNIVQVRIAVDYLARWKGRGQCAGPHREWHSATERTARYTTIFIVYEPCNNRRWGMPAVFRLSSGVRAVAHRAAGARRDAAVPPPPAQAAARHAPAHLGGPGVRRHGHGVLRQGATAGTVHGACGPGWACMHASGKAVPACGMDPTASHGPR